MAEIGHYLRPGGLDEALRLLGAAGPTPPRVLAGGTDLYPAQAGAEAWMTGPAAPPGLLDITGLPELRGIADCADHHRIGAATPWAAIRDAIALPAWFDGLRAAASEVGGVQVQGSGTIGGNLCNASPAADGVPPLLALDAAVELASAAGGTRRLPLAAFLRGNRLTALRPDELLVAVIVPKPDPSARAGFLKLGARRYLVISIAMVAAVVELRADARVARARIAVGACAAIAQRLPRLEDALVGLVPSAMPGAVRPEHLAPLSPIDDVRATADYRREAALVLVRRLLARLATTTAQDAAA